MRLYWIACLLWPVYVQAQDNPYTDPPDTEAEYRQQYAWRVQQEYLFGVYIPRDLYDAFRVLDEKISERSKQRLLSVDEETAWRKLFFSFGRWMMVNWAFYEGSRFENYLRKLGLGHPDDMVRFMIVTYHRHLSGKPLQVKELVAELAEARRKAHLERLQQGEVLHEEEIRKRDTLRVDTVGSRGPE